MSQAGGGSSQPPKRRSVAKAKKVTSAPAVTPAVAPTIAPAVAPVASAAAVSAPKAGAPKAGTQAVAAADVAVLSSAASGAAAVNAAASSDATLSQQNPSQSPSQQAPVAKAEKPSTRAKRPAVAQKGRVGRKLRVACVVLLVLVLALAVAFSVFRWVAGDDAQDMQGTWYVNGTDVTISITEEEMVLAEDVSYAYQVDSFAKTLAFQFSDLSGSGHYRFSLDRGELAIIDGEITWFDALGEDIRWTFGALLCAMQGKEAVPAEGEQVTLLTRQPVTLVPAEPPAPDAAA